MTPTLAEAQRIADALQFACRNPAYTPDFTGCGGPAAEAYWGYFTPARISALLAAVDAALKRHVPDVIDMADGQFRYCSTCSSHPAWPCPEVAAITAALAGEEAGE